jgi:glycine cleavage system H protein
LVICPGDVKIRSGLAKEAIMEVNGYNMPDDLYYDEHHFWVRPDGDVYVMGMDDFAQKLAGEIVYVQLPDDGKRLKAGKKFAKVESGKWLGKVFAPFNGEIETVNEDLETDPGIINSDCYEKGWMYRLIPKDTPDLSHLYHGPETVEKWMAEEFEKYKDELEG